MAAQALGVHEDDYSLLKDLKLEVDREECTFSLCFWLYLLNSTRSPATIIRQMRTGSDGDAPLLALNKERKLMLLPLSVHEEAPQPGSSISGNEVSCASSEVDCPLARWVHVGCEVSTSFLRLHIDGVLKGEKPLSPASENDSSMDNMKKITLAGAEGEGGKLLGYAHFPRILPLASSIHDHYVQNPPIALSIDSSCISEIEEGGDGVWSIVGGKASCRRNFSLDVVLLDALGHPVNKDMEVVASLQYADNGLPVEKPNDAEAPLLTSYDGIEFASFVRPSKLLHGRASFKLKISQLSSKCDNRLFRLRFDSPKAVKYPFLEAYSHPIRCISRSRNTRTSLPWKKSTSYPHPFDGLQALGLDDGSPEIQQNNGDGHLSMSIVRDSKSSPPPKRVKVGADKLSARIHAGPTADRPDAGIYSHAMKTNQGENGFGASLEGKLENLEGTDNTPSDDDNMQGRKLSSKTISDLAIFKYCLGSLNQRSLLLRELTASASDQEMTNFAHQVSLYTGCSHHRYQISIAKRLVQEGTDAWDAIAQGNNHVLWENVAIEIEEQFMKISHSTTRCLTEQDFELLRKIAGCREYATRENFDKIWHWLYPVAFSLSRDWINSTWECTSPKWIEGFITKEEAEASLRGPRGFQDPGTFILRFPTSRSWPHPDAGSLIVTYVGADHALHHRLLSLDYRETNSKPLQVLLLAEPQLTQLGRVIRDVAKTA